MSTVPEVLKLDYFSYLWSKIIKFSTLVGECHLKVTMYQIIHLGPTFYFMKSRKCSVLTQIKN